MILIMRTTIDIDDPILEDFRMNARIDSGDRHAVVDAMDKTW